MDIQFPQILFYIINFSVVAGGLTYLLYKPVGKMLDARSEKIEAAQKAAESTLKANQDSEATKQRLLKSAEKEAQEKVQEAIKKANEQAKMTLAKAKEEAAGVMGKMQRDFDAEKSELLQTWKKKFEAQVIKTSERVIGKAVDKKLATEMIESDLSELLKSLA